MFMVLIHFSCSMEIRTIFIPYEFVTRLDLSLPGPAETAPGMPILTSLSVRLPGPVVSLFCLWAERGLSLPVSALSLLSQQVIASSVSAVSPLALLSSTQGCPGVSHLPSRIIYSLFQRLEEEFCFVFKIFHEVVANQAFRGLWEAEVPRAHTGQKLLAW